MEHFFVGNLGTPLLTHSESVSLQRRVRSSSSHSDGGGTASLPRARLPSQMLPCRAISTSTSFIRTVEGLKEFDGGASSPHWAPSGSTVRSRKFTVVDIQKGRARKNQVQTPELLRLVHTFNRRQMLEDTAPGALKLRDLRQIFGTVGSSRPSIEPRRNCILVNLPPNIRCIIMNEMVYLIPHLTSESHEEENDGTSALQAKLVKLTEIRTSMPFEIAALEACLVEACSRLSDQFTPLRGLVERLAEKMGRKAHSQLQRIAELRRKVDNVSYRAKGLTKALNEILENEDDMRRLEISRFWEKPELFDDPPVSANAGEIEILLECYAQEVESLNTQLLRLDEQLDDSLQMMELHLGSVRNFFLKAELGLEIVGVVVGFTACVASIFGMNMPNGFEENGSLFQPLSQLMVGMCVGTGLTVLWAFNRMKI